MAQVKEKYHCEYRGVTLYFCCAHCAKAFRRSQDKFVADANAHTYTNTNFGTNGTGDAYAHTYTNAHPGTNGHTNAQARSHIHG